MSNLTGSWIYKQQQQSGSTRDDITATGEGNPRHAHNSNNPQVKGTHKVEEPHQREGKVEPQTNEGQDHGFYQCNTCKKTYNRADHLIRHVRSHTHEKPYVCEICGKGFARPDLLKRHASGHEEEEKSPAEGSASKKRKIAASSSASQSSRVTQACKACACSKLKCSDSKPCERCKKKKLVCQESSPDDGPNFSPSRGQINGFSTHDGDGDYRSTNDAEQDLLQTNHIDMSNQNSNPTSIPRSEAMVADGVLELNGSYFPEFLKNVVVEPGASVPMARSEPAATFNQSFFPQSYVAPGSDDDHGWSADLWYSDGLQDAFNMPFESTFTPYAPTMSSNSESSSLAGVGADAFKHSLIGSWTPKPEDSSMMERQNLVAPKNVDSMLLFAESKTRLQEPLSLNARDRILGMVLEACPHSASSRIIASFPSAEFLTNCIQYYFSRRHEEQIDSYIHLPTLKPNEQRAELLAMLAGAGAVCTSSSVIRKLGYALQEAVRQATGKRVCNISSTHSILADAVNSLTRTVLLHVS
jgi:Zinc finger, C2H2 type